MSVNIINELIGKIIIKVEKFDNEILFHLSNGAIYKQHHEQDCCEYVHIEDINGDLNDLVGNRLIQAEESYQKAKNNDEYDSATWSFYKFATIKGYVTIRWFGSSNGYYSESANMVKIKEEDPIREQRRKKLNKLNERLY